MKKVLTVGFICGLIIVFFAAVGLAIFCPDCGTKNDDVSKFCTNCGKSLKSTGEATKEKPKEEPGLTGMVEKVAPRVVGIRTLKNELNAQLRDMGSGFIIDKEGYIITCAHVISDPEDLETINVVLADKKEYKAQIIAIDYSVDLALLKIKADNLIPVNIGDSDKIASGDKVFVVGNPMGLEKSTSSGIVSAKDRYLGCYEYEALIQTDAAVNPGNSGGPLFNMQGEVIGITSLGLSKYFTEGLNFAIPTALTSDIIKSIPLGKIKRSWMGIAIQDITPGLKQWEESVSNRKMTESEGVFVSALAEGVKTPFKKGDIIVKLNDIPVKKAWELQKAILKTKPGDEINVTVKRDGKEQSLKVKISQKTADGKFPVADEMNVMFGVTFSSSGSTAKIEKVRPRGFAEGMGFREEYSIEYIYVNKKEGGEKIDTPDLDSFYKAFRRAYNYEKKNIEWKIYFRTPDGKEWYINWYKALTAMTTT